jgi:hypothetical protein
MPYKFNIIHYLVVGYRDHIFFRWAVCHSSARSSRAPVYVPAGERKPPLSNSIAQWCHWVNSSAQPHLWLPLVHRLAFNIQWLVFNVQYFDNQYFILVISLGFHYSVFNTLFRNLLPIFVVQYLGFCMRSRYPVFSVGTEWLIHLFVIQW